MDNPVYYVQYAHARICSVLRKAADQGIAIPAVDAAPLSALTNAEELDLMKLMDQFADVAENAGKKHEPARNQLLPA